jgi:outer membrane protein
VISYLGALGSLFFILNGSAMQVPTSNASKPLTIEDAVAIAQRNAFSIRLQASAVEKSRRVLDQTAAGLGPSLNSTTTYTRNGHAQVSSFGAGSSFVLSPIDSKTVGLNFNLPIDISGNLQRQVAASRENLRSTEKNFEAALNDSKLTARQAFIAVLRAKATVRVQEEAVKNSTAQLDLGRKLLAGEQIAQVDVTRYEAQLAQSNADLLTAQNGLELAKYALNDALARPIETPLEVSDIYTLPSDPAEVNELVKTGQFKRPEVQSYLHSLKSLALVRRANEVGQNPSLSLGLNYSRNLDPSGLSAQTETTTGTLTLSIPLYDNGITRSKVRAASQDELQAQISLQQVQLTISQDVRNAFTNLSSARARLRNADEQVRLASEVFRLANIKQQAAEGTYIDVIDAENSLTQAKNTQVGARYDFLVAYAQLQRAVGTDQVVAKNTSAQPATGGTSK